MPKRLTRDEFIRRAQEVHGNFYNYDNVQYSGSIKKVNIQCKIHGAFLQTPNAHINDGSGCNLCRRLSEKEFFKRVKKIHGDKYDYSKVIWGNTQSRVTIVCPKHGDFQQFVNNHLRGMGCAICSGNTVSNTKEFIRKASLIHGSLYNYKAVDYKNAKTKVKIQCQEHGYFWQTPNNHLTGQGCRMCADKYRKGGYNMDYFRQYPHKSTEMGKLYLLRLWNDNEEFYKIGITQKDQVSLRFRYHTIPYQYEVVEEKTGPLGELYTLEQHLLGTLDYRYVPSKKFSGHTECFEQKVNLNCC